jgi:MFS family permease
MLAGYFMTLIDWTAVSVANPSIMAALRADYESVVWVTSAYLLGFAVPLMVAGRLGDRFGPKYVSGLPSSPRRHCGAGCRTPSKYSWRRGQFKASAPRSSHRKCCR